MSIAIKHNGVYRFQNYRYQTKGDNNKDLVLNAFGTNNLANGRNVILYELSTSDTAQQWRAMYAGKDGGKKLYWLNCELGGRSEPFALDRYMGSDLINNADVYKAKNSSAADQLVYFEEVGNTGRVIIRLYYNDFALTAAPNNNGINGPESPIILSHAGNVYWEMYTNNDLTQEWIVTTVSAGEDPTTTDRATEFPAESYYTEANNSSFPDYVGECTWYCKGRFHEVNETVICCTGNAYEWETGNLGNAVVRDTTNKTLRENSVAVFGAGGSSNLGHVVFIESIEGDNVIWSDCNGTRVNNTFSYSNGEIEVRNSALSTARDGYKKTTPKSTFPSLFGSGLKAIIYKP